MVQHVATVAFEGVEARPVDVQVQVAPGLPAFNLVGLPDKAVSEAKERVRAALIASGLALPAKRITINMAPADLPKEGSHFDLPIALGLMAAIGAVPSDALAGFSVLGELGLDGSLAPVAGVLPAAVAASSLGLGLICPKACGPEAAWASPEMNILRSSSLLIICAARRSSRAPSRKFEPHWNPHSISRTSVDRKPRSARSRLPRQAATIFCSSARRARASRCSPHGFPQFFRRLRPQNCSKCP